MATPSQQKVTVSLTRVQHDEIQRLWKDHSGAVHSMLLSWCGNPTDAADILQEVFLRIARQPESLKSIRQPRSFLVVAARRIGIDLARKRVAEERRNDAVEIEISSNPSPYGQSDEEMREIFQQALATLPAEQKIVLESKIIHGKTLAVIAVEQGITLNTAASRLRYSLDKMRNELRPHYETMKKSPFHPQNPSVLNKPIEQGERLIKPLEAKRVPSVIPGFEGLVALAPEHGDQLHDSQVVSDSFEDHDHETVGNESGSNSHSSSENISDHSDEGENSHTTTDDHAHEDNLVGSPHDPSEETVDTFPQPDDTELMVATLFEETNIEEHVDPVIHVDPFPFENILSVEIVPENDHVDTHGEGDGGDLAHGGDVSTQEEISPDGHSDDSVEHPQEGTIVIDEHSDFEGGLIVADGGTFVDTQIHAPVEMMHDIPVAYAGAHGSLTMEDSTSHADHAKDFNEMDSGAHTVDPSQLRGTTYENHESVDTYAVSHDTVLMNDPSHSGATLNLSNHFSETIAVESKGSLAVGEATHDEVSHDATSTALNEAFHSSSEMGSVNANTSAIHHSPVGKVAAHAEVESHLTTSIETNPMAVANISVNVSASNSPIDEQAHTDIHPHTMAQNLPEILPMEANAHSDADHSGHEADDFVVVAFAPSLSAGEISEVSENFSAHESAPHDIQTSEVLGGAFVVGTATQSSGFLTQKRNPILK